MKTTAYYKGRESVWRELYEYSEARAAALQEKLEPLEKRVFGDKEDKAMIYNMSNQIDEIKKKIVHKDQMFLQLQRECFAILTDVMNRSNNSAEERLNYIRSNYKQQYMDLANVYNVGK